MSQKIKYDTRAIELLHDTAQNEYSNEHERTATMDSKAGIALPIIAAYFLALAQMNDYKSIVGIPVSDFLSVLLPAALLITYTAALGLSFIGLIRMTQVVFTREYYKINPMALFSEDYLQTDSRVLSARLIKLYFEAIEHNRGENDLRVKQYQQSWRLTFASLICFVFYIIIKNNI